MPDYDIIGDVHGCGEQLEGLLHALGYVDRGSCHRHPDRRAVFVGDLVDRGPDQLHVLELVFAMCDGGAAQVLMGNHELNALAYAQTDPTRPGRYLRSHSARHRRQHAAFLDQLSPNQQAEYLARFLELPLWSELDGVRIVHACWDDRALQTIEQSLGGSTLASPAGLAAASGGDPSVTGAVTATLKGPEIDLRAFGLPAYLDEDGYPRTSARTRWWRTGTDVLADLIELPEDATGTDGGPYPAIPRTLRLPAHRLGGDRRRGDPVVYGHYWRRWGPTPGLDWTPATACVDFSAVRGGPLVAYRWSRGDGVIDPSNYVARW